MSKSKDLPKSLPSKNHEFVFEGEGQLTKQRLIGEFSCTIPNLKMQAMISKHRAFLNGELADFLDSKTLKLHHMISYLRYSLTEHPKWWKVADLGYDLDDYNIVEEIYLEVLKFEESWLREVWGDEAVEELTSGKKER